MKGLESVFCSSGLRFGLVVWEVKTVARPLFSGFETWLHRFGVAVYDVPC